MNLSNINQLDIIMISICLFLLLIFIILRFRHSLLWRKHGHSLWNIVKIEAKYDGVRQFKNKNSWLCKAKKIPFVNYEFQWSPGGGFSLAPYFLNTIFLVLMLFLSIYLWQIAILILLIVPLIGRML